MKSSVTPPNGDRVTQAQLYQALYDLDQNMAEAFTQVHEGLNDLRGDLSNHAADGHPYTQKAETVREEIRLDARKMGVLGGLLAIAATLGGLLVKALDLLGV